MNKNVKLLFHTVIACFCILYSNVSSADISNPFELPVPYSSVSHSRGEYSPLINPVFSDTFNASSLSYRWMSYEDHSSENHLLLLNLAGFTLAYTWLNNLYDFNSEIIERSETKVFSIGRGFWINNSFGIGVNYSFSKSGMERYDDYKSWTAGLLIRPFQFISLGYAARDMNSPSINGETIRRKDIYSMSLRPFGSRVTLSFDLIKTSGKDFSESNYIYSADIKAIGDISIFACADKDKNISGGITLPIDFSASSSSTIIMDYYGLRGNGRPGFSQFGFTVSGERYISPVIISKKLLVINMREHRKEEGIERLFKRKGLPFYEMLNAIREAGRDSGVSGIVLRIDKTDFGLAQIQEIRRELNKFKNSGKRVYAVLTVSGNRDYYLASISDKIFFIPGSTFSITTLKAEIYFLKETLNKIGIKFESIRRGKYKSFNEQFTRNHMSEEFRENLTSVLKDLNEQYLNDITRARNMTGETIDRLINRTGIMTPEQALKTGFIDAVEYPDNAMRSIRKEHDFNTVSVNLEDYIEQSKRNSRWGQVPCIGIVYVTGGIVRGGSQKSDFSSHRLTGDETYRKMLGRAFSDSSVKAVVIRINSGGGSAIASDLMLHYLTSLKKRYKKPVIFSFGNTAASGGYYIACTGDSILANEGTITGSIGVVSGKLSLKRLYKKLGINKDVIKMSRFADIFSEAKDMTPEEKAIFTKAIEFIYKNFTDKVKKSRKLKDRDIPNIAEGRVFTGKQAMKNRLVDKIGGIIAAVEYARNACDIKYCRVKHYPEKKTPISEILGVNSNLLLKRFEPLFESMKWLSFNDESFLYLYPYFVEIK